MSASTSSISLDEVVGRQAAVGDAEIHRAARGDDADAELGGRAELGLDEAGDAAREDVVVVEDGRAAGERELGEAGAGRGVHHLLVDPRPDRVERPQPREEVGVLRPGAREGLVEVVVGVDEPGVTTAPPRSTRSSAGRRLARADCRDQPVLDPQPAALVLRAGVVQARTWAPERIVEGVLTARRTVQFPPWTSSPHAASPRRSSSRPSAPTRCPLQGGTDVMVAINFDRARPRAVLNLNEVAELRGWSRDNGSLRLGAGLTYTEAMTGELARAAARARRGVAHGGLAADPQPRHDRRQSRDGLARRRRAAAARSSRAPRSSARRCAASRRVPLGEFVTGREAERARRRRADRRRLGARRPARRRRS